MSLPPPSPLEIRVRNLSAREQRMLESLLDAVERTRFLGGCLGCDNWDHLAKAGGCKLAGGQVPPAKVIVNGCERYVEDIPF